MRAPGARPKSARVGYSTCALGSLLAKEMTVPSGATRWIAAPSEGPPTPSTMTSNSGPSGVSSWMTSSAPRSVRPRARSGLAETAVTWAPPMWASCTAKRPTPPLAPVTSTRRAIGVPPMSRASRAVIPATGSAAACAKLTSSGRTAMAFVATAASWAHALSCRATTRAPSGGPLPSAACRRTVPARSQPVRLPEGLFASALTSPRLSEIASTATRAWLGRGSGSGASPSSTPGSAEKARRASTGRTLPIGVRLPRCENRLMDPHAHPGPVASAYAARRREFEDAWLSPLAARSWPARRARPEEDCGLRTPLQRDRDRIVHSKAFRRLKHKTQVFVAPEGDHFRTRLTHTLEVTQISRTVARALPLNEDLTEAIGLGHDLGHPPFGHIGEAVLDDCLSRRFGSGFRHYEHSLRVVDVLERDGVGLNLGEDVRDGILCHSGRAPMPRTLEGRIVRVGARIAYINHDIDDAVRAGVLREDDLPVDPIAVLGDTGSHRIDALVHDLVEHSERAGDIAQGDEAGEAMAALREFMFDRVYMGTAARREHAKIDRVVRTLFDHFADDPARLPDAGGAPGADLPQRVTDYVAGMTDRYCIRAFEALSVPEAFAL